MAQYSSRARKIAASSGFVVYSWILQNWVFVVTNSAMLLTAMAAQVIQIRNGKLTR
jgi:MtN3 and saliva related transmembrane protein